MSIKVQDTIAQKCSISIEHWDTLIEIASSRNFDQKEYQTNFRIDVVSFSYV